MSVLAAYVATVAVFLLMPGPLNLVIMNGAARYGLKGALLSVAATNAASLLWIAAAGLMLAGIAEINPRWLDGLATLGGLYLIYYGYRQWAQTRRAHAKLDHAAAALPQSAGMAQMMVSAFLVGVSNPKDIIFFMTFFPPFIGRLEMALLPALLLLTLIWCVLDYVILTAYGLGLAKLLTPRREKIIHALSGILFMALGLYAAGSGLASAWG